jgi:hypothetical protein
LLPDFEGVFPALGLEFGHAGEVEAAKAHVGFGDAFLGGFEIPLGGSGVVAFLESFSTAVAVAEFDLGDGVVAFRAFDDLFEFEAGEWGADVGDGGLVGALGGLGGVVGL